MNIRQDVSLRDYSTMRLGGNAAYLAEVSSAQELIEAVNWADGNKQPVIVIGGGSNIIWRDEGFKGLVIVNKILGFVLQNVTEQDMYVTVGAGENWDSVVQRIVEKGYSGVEELSLIPGTAGAAPVQNIGAYGRELSSTLTSVQAYDRINKQTVNLPRVDCRFGYRTSRFKTTDKSRFCILSITLHVSRANPQPPFYAALATHFEQTGITTYTPQVIRDAVIYIRSTKLPDPAFIANNGSFFTNPFIDEADFSLLRDDYPSIVGWPVPDGKVKVSAAWLIENAGFKNVHDQETGMATWERQPLVFINEHAKSTADLLKFRQKVVDAVKAKFHIELTQEPELI
jgi:UDP-N-acetylmuramate dehydrogenase